MKNPYPPHNAIAEYLPYLAILIGGMIIAGFIAYALLLHAFQPLLRAMEALK